MDDNRVIDLPPGEIFKRIKLRLEDPLPGQMAQGFMAPDTHPGKQTGIFVREGRPSSVLLLLFPILQQRTGIVFIRRPEYDGPHSGQISFPGGKPEPGDPDLLHTALRESEEEIGINARDVEILGTLSPLYIPPSHFLVTPFVGSLSHAPSFKAQASEVAEVVPVDIETLLQQQCISSLHIRHDTLGSMMVPCYHVNGIKIWGATAMILAEFLEILKTMRLG